MTARRAQFDAISAEIDRLGLSHQFPPLTFDNWCWAYFTNSSRYLAPMAEMLNMGLPKLFWGFRGDNTEAPRVFSVETTAHTRFAKASKLLPPPPL